MELLINCFWEGFLSLPVVLIGFAIFVLSFYFLGTLLDNILYRKFNRGGTAFCAILPIVAVLISGCIGLGIFNCQ